MHVTNHMTAALGAAKDGSKRVVAVFAVLAASMALVMAMAAPAAAQTTVEGADGDVWVPDSIEVEAGTTVTFNMTGGSGGHNGVIDGTEIFGFTPIGESVSHTFNDEGTFVLQCTIHPGMDMDVVVTAATNGDDNGDDNGDNGDDNGDNGDNGEEPVDTEDPTDPADTEDPADTADDTDDVEQPTAVESGSGGLVNTGLPMWVAAMIGLGALALVAPAVATRRRS
jgi:plastocyanin